MVAKNMSAYVKEDGRRPKHDESSSPVLSKECVQSILTINPINPTVSGGMSPLSSSDQHVRRRRRNQLVVGSGSRIKTSVAVSSFTTNGDAGYDTGHTTMIASCSDGARIHVATITERTGDPFEKEVRMKYSSRSDDGNTPSYAAVCIANFDSSDKPNQHNAAILALDTTEGKIYAHHAHKSDESHLFDMEICFNDDDVGNSKQKSPKRSRKISNAPKSTQQICHPFTSMNTLTPRQELLNSRNNNNPKSSSQEIPPSSTPTRKGKRKATSPSRTSDGSHTIYAVASRLNESHFLPIQFASPVLIRLSLDGHQGSKRLVSWTKIPGLDHVHSSLSCITFASRALCGNKLWNSIVSLMRFNQSKAQTESGDDEGIVLMGCQDGSLYCTTVTNGEPCKASKLLQLNGGEPILSLALLRTESTTSSKLMCFGALGTIAIICNSTSKNDVIDFVLKRLPFDGRWCSLATVGYNGGPSNDTELLSIIGTTDSGKSYFCQFSIDCPQDPSEKKSLKNLELQKKFRLPIAHGNVSCVDACPSITLPERFQFVSYSLGGKISLMRIPSSGWKMVPRAARSKQSLLAMLRQNGKSLQCSLPSNQRAHDNNATSKYKSVFRTLKSAIGTKQESVDTQAASLDATSIHAADEVRDAIRVISLSSRNALPPIHCNITASKCVQGFDLEMKNEKRHTTSSWCHSIHTIISSNSTLSPMLRPESINNMTPLCYRRTRKGLIKVLFGGSSSSLSCQNSSSVHVPVCNFGPVSVYASLSKIIKDNQLNKPNIRFDKKPANMQQGVVVPFTLGKRSSIPLSGDTMFTPFLNFARIIRNASDGTEARSIAEREVQQMIQARKGVNGSEKMHCCSSSVLLASSKHMEQYHGNESHNNGAPIALVFRPRQGSEICDLGFALGSDDMSLLPLVRHSIIRYSRSEEKLRSDVLKNEFYRVLLTDKRAAKIARHVDKNAREMISRIESDSSSDDNTPTALLTKCLSLYEIMRTLQFIIG
jgi:hypothetical protein